MKTAIIYLMVTLSTLSIPSYSSAATIAQIEKARETWNIVENSIDWDSWGGDPEIYGYIFMRKTRDGETKSGRVEVGNAGKGDMLFYNSSLARKWDIIYYLSNGSDDMSIFAVNNGDKTATFYELGELKDGAKYGAGNVIVGSTKLKPEQLSKTEVLVDIIHDNGAISVSQVNEYWNGIGKIPEIIKDLKANAVDGLYYFTDDIDKISRNENENSSYLPKDWDVIYYSGGDSEGEMAFLNNDDGTAYTYPPRSF